MNVALISYRFPWPPYTGDRVRAIRWLSAMLPLGDVTLVSPSGVVPEAFERVRHVELQRSNAALIAGAVTALRTGLPLHTLAAAGFNWRAAFTEAGEQDAVVVLLSRCDPWTRGFVALRRVIDAIDASAASMTMRARTAGLAAPFWSAESKKAARLEASFGAKYDAVVVVNAAEKAGFGGNVVVEGSGVELLPLADAERDVDFAFWGRLAYFSNKRAAMLLLKVWPDIRRMLPDAKLLIGGSDVPSQIRSRDGHDGVCIVSPLIDRAATLRRVRVAVLPMEFGTGVSNKVLEAAEAGCAAVAMRQALSGLEPIAAHARIADDADALVRHCVALGRDPEAARREGHALRRAAEEHYSSTNAESRLRRILTEPRA